MSDSTTITDLDSIYAAFAENEEPTTAEELAHAIHNQISRLPDDLASAYRRTVRALLDLVAPDNTVSELI